MLHKELTKVYGYRDLSSFYAEVRDSAKVAGMNQSTMRKLEQWIGKPVCAALTFARRSRLILYPRKNYTVPQKIVLLKLIEQGASVLAFSAMEECIRRAGRQNVYFWVFEENQEIVRTLNLIPSENFFVLSHKTPWKFFRTLTSNLWRIRRQKIDTVIDMEFFSRASAILAALSGARIRVGLHRFTAEAPYRGDLMTHRVAYNPFLHTAKAYLQLVRCSFEPPSSVPVGKFPIESLEVKAPEFIPTEPEKQQLEELLQSLGLAARSQGPGPRFILNPNASDLLPLRKWPTENFITLAHKLLNAFPEGQIVLTGAPSESEQVAAIAAQIANPRCVSVAGKTSLRSLFTLYFLSDVLVTNDSGPGHFASMTPVDSIVLFGPETPALFGPLGKTSHVLWQNLACSPCVSAYNHRLSACTDPICMRTISVEMVWNKIQEVLSHRKLQGALTEHHVPATSNDGPHLFFQ